MKIRINNNRYDYMGLAPGSYHNVERVVVNEFGEKEYYFTHLGRKWALTANDCDELVRLEELWGSEPNEKLMDVINTDLKKEECRSSYCECEEGKCSGGKVDMRADKTEKKESVLDIQHGGSHYKDKGIQPIEYITANNLGFCEGNIVKYASRHQDKNGAEDIRKVIHYAQFILKFQYNEDI